MSKKRTSRIPYDEINNSFKIIVSAKNAEQKDLLRAIGDNTITLVKGPAGTGKCITLDSMVSTGKGLVNLSDVMHSEDDSCQEINTNIVNRYGDFEPASHIYNSGVRTTKFISTESGYSIEGTKNHRILCLTKTGIEWQHLRDVFPGTIVCINRTFPSRKGKSDNDLAYFLGLMIGDGSYTLKNTFSFSNIDSVLISFFQDFCQKRFDRLPQQSKSRPCDWTLCSQKARQQLLDWGLSIDQKYEHKQIPVQWLSQPTKFICSLLQGLFDTDGWVEKSGTICFLSKSKLLSKQVQLLLLELGVVSTFGIKTVKYKNQYREFYQISILHSGMSEFAEFVGFRVPHKLERLNTVLVKNRNTNKDTVPSIFAQHLLKDYYKSFKHKDRTKRNPFRWYTDGSRSPSYTKLSELYDQFRDRYHSDKIENILEANYYFDSVVETANRRKPVGDFVVPGSHSFIANGFVNHNTFLGVTYALQQLLSGKCEKMVLTRPVVEAAGEKLGYLPGDMFDKIDPYMIPIFDSLMQMIPRTTLDKMMAKNGKDASIRILPLAYMRGVTFRNSFIICDEMQNSTPDQVRMLLTRLGEESKMILCGDTRQTDIIGKNGLEDAFELLSGIDGIGFVELSEESIVRHPLIAAIERKYEERQKKLREARNGRNA